MARRAILVLLPRRSLYITVLEERNWSFILDRVLKEENVQYTRPPLLGEKKYIVYKSVWQERHSST